MGELQTRLKGGAPRHFIRQWRKFRRLSQEKLAEQLGVTHGAISQLERGHTSYTQPTLEKLAHALQCTPADLIARNPYSDESPVTVFDGLDTAERQEALRFIEYLKRTKQGNRTGTGG